MAETGKEYVKAINYIIEMIKQGRLSVGSKLPTERVLATELEISRNSTREALRTLENMGVIECHHGSGNYVTGEISKVFSSMISMMLMLEKFSESEIHRFRKSMEKTVCSMLIEQKTDMVVLVEKAEGILNEVVTSSEQEIEADKRFHYLLIEATDNRLLISIMKSVSDIYRSMIHSVFANADPSMKKQLTEAHRAILSALKSGSKERCEEAIEHHYSIIDDVLKKKEVM